MTDTECALRGPDLNIDRAGQIEINTYNRHYTGWCLLGDLDHSHRDKDLEKRWREDMVLPIDASIPFPPPSGSVCRPSASSMIASKASPAKPKRSISKRDQSVHHCLCEIHIQIMI